LVVIDCDWLRKNMLLNAPKSCPNESNFLKIGLQKETPSLINRTIMIFLWARQATYLPWRNLPKVPILWLGSIEWITKIDTLLRMNLINKAYIQHSSVISNLAGLSVNQVFDRDSSHGDPFHRSSLFLNLSADMLRVIRYIEFSYIAL